MTKPTKGPAAKRNSWQDQKTDLESLVAPEKPPRSETALPRKHSATSRSRHLLETALEKPPDYDALGEQDCGVWYSMTDTAGETGIHVSDLSLQKEK
jgi:hypothetical protein